MVSVTDDLKKLSIEDIDFQSISKVRDIFMSQEKSIWLNFCTNFINNSIGDSAQKLIYFMNSKHLESTYEYGGIDFDDFQRAIPAILRNINKIEKISNTFDWYYVCKNLNKCAYLCFIWTLWPYKTRNDKIRQIYLSASDEDLYAQNIFNIPDVCTWKDWATVMDYKEYWNGMQSQVHATFTDISKIIQYPKTLSDIEKAYAEQVIKSEIIGIFTCQQVHIICCYAYNNKFIGSLHTSEGSILSGSGFYRSTIVYEYSDAKCWFNPLKPTSKKVRLSGYFQLDNTQ